MGTRGLLGVVIDGQRYATYNHFDSYPEGLGKGIMEFLLSLEPKDWAKMAEMVREIEWVDEDSKAPLELQEKYINLDFADETLNDGSDGRSDWYWMLRKMQGSNALPEILSGNLKHMIQNVKFLKDGLFCEWAYFVDFEKKTIEIWAHGQFLEKISLEGVNEEGLEQCLERMEELGEDSYDKYQQKTR
ncbi:uncharacterized protein LY89DRAFT_376614 [Mollisia scopiformis]|uniref:Uncharacterized protein n=1 Tax=Mollisia scopiformis TaxID=149040 RepID=A0A194XN13_MOLSC|nr:uncharacterized protein LY89DRAFT_376614 [Mollisia scopiformis]KUJ21516.1 hypothetical protein LY89DRAFT_376614 [Mollisia scopiformis]